MAVRQEIIELLQPLKALNSDQYIKCQESAKADVLTRIGSEPLHETYLKQVRLRTGMRPNDWFGIALFFVLLCISLIHMVEFTGVLSNASYTEQIGTGITFSKLFWVTSHQLTFFAFSELGVLFFFIRHTMDYLRWSSTQSAEVVAAKKWRRWVSVSSGAAFACAIVAIIANVSSQTQGVMSPQLLVISAGIGFLIPILTLFLGERAAEILMVYQQQREDADSKWYADHQRWYYSSSHPESYDEGDRTNTYRHYLARRIVEYYKLHIEPRLPQRITWTPEIELALAGRELARLRKLEALDEMETFFTSTSNELPPQESLPILSSETVS